MHVCARVAVQDILHTGAQTFSVFPEALIRTCSAQFTTFLIRIIMFCWKKVVHTSILKCLLEQLKFYVCFVFGISHSSHQGLNGVGATSGCLFSDVRETIQYVWRQMRRVPSYQYKVLRLQELFSLPI